MVAPVHHKYRKASNVILDTIENSRRYEPLHPLFFRAFEFIRNTDLRALKPGRYPIVGDDLLLIVESVAGRNRELARLECHRRYIDIQFVLEGIDEMGWKSLAECHDPVEQFSVEKDIQFFRDTPATWIATPADAFCIFFPEDAHAPLVASGNIRKAIFKVATLPAL